MTTLLSMELCQGSSRLHPANSQLKTRKNIDIKPSSLQIRHNTSAKEISLVQQQTRRECLLRHPASAGIRHALTAAIAGDFRKPTTSCTSNYLNFDSPRQHELPNEETNTSLYFKRDTKRNSTTTKMKRIEFHRTRDADVAPRSGIIPKECHTERMMNPIGQFQWYYSTKDLPKLPTGTAHLTIPNSSKRKKWEVGVGVGEDLPATYQNDDPLKQIPQRRCGILLHPSSLPGPHGIGDFGKDAYNFLDWLKETGCTVWQVLPLVPPGRQGGEDGSPYAGADANCGNTLLISLELLVHDGLLEPSELPKPVPVKRMNSTKVATAKDPLVAKAAAKLVSLSSGKLKEELEAFRKDPKIASWVEEAALFAAIGQSTKATTWWTWPSHLRDRDPNAMKAARHEHKTFIDIFVAAQYLFQRQWQSLHKYANDAGIRILGDMPMNIGGHSADVWAHRSCFDLDPKTGAPLTVSGVPPDSFSATGQLWGSPLYNWKEMAKDKYSWWARRILRAYDLFDEFRIDHFRGFAGYWSIPSNAPNAISGKWKAGPGKPFFTAMKEAVGKRIDIVAEDLGIVTTDVVTLRKELHAPGMAVLQFAFGDNARNPHLLHNHEFDQVVYPGTHDNDTCVGWWRKATDEEKERAKKYLRCHNSDAEIHWEMIRSAAASVARTAIIPMQDVMGLDNNARMNIPATQAGNWGWRIGDSEVFQKLQSEKKRLRKFLGRYNRLTPEFHEKWKERKKVAKSNKKLSVKKDDKLQVSSAARSMAKTIGKSLESLTGLNLMGKTDFVAKIKVEKAKENAAKEEPGTILEKLKEKLNGKESPLKETTLEKPPKESGKGKDDKPKEKKPNEKTKEKPKENRKDKGKENPNKK